MFISFEGLDGCGKTTQARLLKERYEADGNKVLLLREPGGTLIGEKIRNILLDNSHTRLIPRTEILLFSAARAQLVDEIILPALQQGSIVLCDRYVDSTTAYQGYGRGLQLDAVSFINDFATEHLLPDITFFIDIPIAETIHRRNTSRLIADRMEDAEMSFFQCLYNGFHWLHKKEPQRFIRIDGMKTIEDIHAEIWTILQKRFA